MMWLSNIKNYLIGALAILSGVLYGMSRINKAEKEKADNERDNLVDDIRTAEQVIEVNKDARQIEKDVSNINNDDVINELRKYDRNRNNTGTDL